MERHGICLAVALQEIARPAFDFCECVIVDSYRLRVFTATMYYAMTDCDEVILL